MQVHRPRTQFKRLKFLLHQYNRILDTYSKVKKDHSKWLGQVKVFSRQSHQHQEHLGICKGFHLRCLCL